MTAREKFTIVEFRLEGPIEPRDLKKIEPPPVDLGRGVVLSGRGPIWLYGFLIHHYHPAAWVATFDPRLKGAVVVQSHVKGVSEGDVIPVGSEEPGEGGMQPVVKFEPMKVRVVRKHVELDTLLPEITPKGMKLEITVKEVDGRLKAEMLTENGFRVGAWHIKPPEEPPVFVKRLLSKLPAPLQEKIRKFLATANDGAVMEFTIPAKS